jgi:hypothetical protein
VEILKYIAWGLALFFAATWTIGILHKPEFRHKSFIVTILFWWLGIGLAMLGFYNVLYLFWLMPLSIFVPSFLERIQRQKQMDAGVFSLYSVPFGIVFISSSIPL